MLQGRTTLLVFRTIIPRMTQSLLFAHDFENMPNELAVFPLPSAVLLPRGHLPLNIFESRYLNMVIDSMKSHQLIGMIQPSSDGMIPDLFSVGCAGRIRRYEETNDDRIQIELVGICRFQIKSELPPTAGYRRIIPDWEPYQTDFDPPPSLENNAVDQFKAVLTQFLRQNNIETEISLLQKLETEDLVNGLIGFLPIGNKDKQLLLECESLEMRLKAFTAVLNAETKNDSSQQQ